MLKTISFALVCAACYAPPAFAQALPTTAPVPADPQSTPRGAVKLLITAMTNGDAKAIRSVVVANNPMELRLMDSWIAQQESIVKFQKAVNAALGPRAARRLLGDVAADRASAIEGLANQPEKISGDTATVGEGEQEEQLVRQNGKWVLTMASMIPIACGASGVDQQEIEESIKGMNIRSRILSQTADELSQGRYRTVAQVQRAMEAKQSALDRTPPATAPATAPQSINKPAPPPGDSEELVRAQHDVETLKSTLSSRTPEQLIATFILLGSQRYRSYEYFHDYMANLAIREELASRGSAIREALQRHINDSGRIFEAVNGPGDTVGRVCRELLQNP